jgi:hypothetical protein
MFSIKKLISRLDLNQRPFVILIVQQIQFFALGIQSEPKILSFFNFLQVSGLKV